MIETKAKLLMETIPKERIQKIESESSTGGNIWSRDFLGFKKVLQLLTHKAKVRWERILREVLTDFHEIYIEIFLRAILNLNATVNVDLTISPDMLEKISNQLKVNIVYFVCENGQIFNKVEYGKYKYDLKIGYMKADEKYAFFEKMPRD